MPQKTPLYDLHLAAGSKIVDFAGWLLPVQYKSIIEEHKAVRAKAGVFDIGHMGQIISKDTDALQYLTANDVSTLDVFRGQYSFMCNEKGGVIDDLIIYRMEDSYFVVANAVNAHSVFSRISKKDRDAKLLYQEMTAIALQGPDSFALMKNLSKGDLSELKHRQIKRTSVSGRDCLISRSGYSGEDGFEIFLKNKDCPFVWSEIVKNGAIPCGLGSRDTLRIEAGLPLYGHEIDEDTTPFEAGYIKTVKMEKTKFSGKEALLRQQKDGLPKHLIGFEVIGKAIPRQGYKIFEGDKESGYVTSGTFSPCLDRPIGMGYIQGPLAEQGELSVEVRGNRHAIREVRLPFYRRKPL